jgi:aspartate aminotransferase
VAQALTPLTAPPLTPVPAVGSAAALAALSGPPAGPAAKAREFEAKRDRVLAALAQIPGVVCPKPEGAFYVFPDIACAFGRRHGERLITDDVDFCSALLEAKGVACVPGSAFGEPRALRISYTCPDAQLDEGLQRMQAFFAELA